MADKKNKVADGSYWRANLTVVSVLLVLWFSVAYIGAIFLIDPLNQVSVGKLGLGFWLAQQGSIFVFVGIVWFYAVWMGRVDSTHAPKQPSVASPTPRPEGE